MFEFARKNSFLMQFVLFIMIASLVLVLFVDYDMVSGNKPVAAVGKTEIGSQEFEQRTQQFITQQQLRNPGADAAQYNTKENQDQILEQMIREEVLSQSAQKLQLPVSDQSLSAYLQQFIKSAGWVKSDGSVDTDAYKNYLVSQGQTAAEFENMVRNNLTQNQALVGLVSTGIANDKLEQATLDALLEKREVQLKSFPLAGIEKELEVTDEQIQDYYNEHPDAFQVPEQIDAEYLVLSMDSIKQNINPSDEEIQDYFEQNKKNYGTPEERKVRHILIENGTDDIAAKTKAEEILAKAKANPQNFAALAKEFSNDPGSAADGGNLGFFKQDGSMVKPFEDAAFALAQNTISDLVKTDYGYHILLVEKIKDSSTPTLEKIKAEIVKTIQESQAQKRFKEEAEQFANMVYETSNLEDVAKRFGLTVQKANKLQFAPAQGTDTTQAVHTPKFLVELFSEESTASKQNTPAVDIGNERLISGRVLQVYPAHTAAFETVKTQAKNALLQDLAEQESKKKAQALLEELGTNKQSAIDSLLPSVVVARNQPTLPQTVIQEALKINKNALPNQALVNLNKNGWAVVRVNKIVPASDADKQADTSERNMAKQLWEQALGEAQYEQMKINMGVEILQQPKSEN